MNSEMFSILFRKINNCIVNNFSNLLIFFIIFSGYNLVIKVSFHNIFESPNNIIALLILLLNGISQFIRNKLAFWSGSRSLGQSVIKLTAVQVSIPHVTFSTMSIPNLKLCLSDICLLLQISGSQPHLLEHSTLYLAQSHFIILGCN